MRYVLVIADGSALAGEGEDLYSALDAVETPALDAMGRLGKVGTAATHLDGKSSFGRGSLALLGCGEDEVRFLSDAALDATLDLTVANADLATGPVSALRVHLVSVSPDDAQGLMVAASAPTMSPVDATDRHTFKTDEPTALLGDLIAYWRDEGLLAGGARVVATKPDGLGGPDVAMLVVPQELGDAPRFVDVDLVDPGLIEGEPWMEHLPDGGRFDDAEFLCRLISASRSFLADHAINTSRAEQGLDPMNLAWFTDPGVVSEVWNPFPSEVACYSDAGFTRGSSVLSLLGLGAAPVDPDMFVDAIAQAQAPIVVAMTRRDAESLDADVVAPLLARLAGVPIDGIDDLDDADWRLLVAVSHDPMGLAGSGGGLAPFALAGGRVRSVVDRRLSGAVGSDLRIDPASDLLEYVLRSGLRGVV